MQLSTANKVAEPRICPTHFRKGPQALAEGGALGQTVTGDVQTGWLSKPTLFRGLHNPPHHCKHSSCPGAQPGTPHICSPAPHPSAPLQRPSWSSRSLRLLWACAEPSWGWRGHLGGQRVQQTSALDAALAGTVWPGATSPLGSHTCLSFLQNNLGKAHLQRSCHPPPWQVGLVTSEPRVICGQCRPDPPPPRMLILQGKQRAEGDGSAQAHPGLHS